MQDVVVAFAKTGDPSTKAVPFPRYEQGNDRRVNFGDRISTEKLDTKGMDFLEANPVAPGPTGRRPGREAEAPAGGPPPSPRY